MPLIGNLLTPAAAAGFGQSLALARAANPRTPVTGTFDQHLDLALQAGIGGGAAVGPSGTDHSNLAPARGALNRSGKLTSMESLRSEHRTSVAQFEDRFRQLMHENGIDAGEEIVLTTDVHGEVRVSGEHPQKDAIERLLRDDIELRNLFGRLHEQAKLLRSADLTAELAQLQAEAPADASDRAQQLYAATPANFSLTVRPHDALVQLNYA